MTFTFRPFEISNASYTYEFLMETWSVSFGKDRSAWPNGLGDYGLEKYAEDIAGIKEMDPLALWSVWDGDLLVGQVEIKAYKAEPQCGYVSLFYLAQEYRGKGFSKQLDDFACAQFKSRGFTKARLTVSQFNNRALGFYEKCAYKVVNTDTKRPNGLEMEKAL